MFHIYQSKEYSFHQMYFTIIYVVGVDTKFNPESVQHFKHIYATYTLLHNHSDSITTFLFERGLPEKSIARELFNKRISKVSMAWRVSSFCILSSLLIFSLSTHVLSSINLTAL